MDVASTVIAMEQMTQLVPLPSNKNTVTTPDRALPLGARFVIAASSILWGLML